MLSYCYQVAGAVGVMMAHVMGVDPAERDTLDRAADLGIAFQLANIARDIVDDAKVGRTYLPDRWLAEEGLTGADLANPAHRQALARITQRLAALAEDYRRSSKVGAARLPIRSRWAVLSAAGIYGEVATRARDARPARVGPADQHFEGGEVRIGDRSVRRGPDGPRARSAAKGCGPALRRPHPRPLAASAAFSGSTGGA